MGYKMLIDAQETLEQLNNVIELIAKDKDLSNREYCELYEYALSRARRLEC